MSLNLAQRPQAASFSVQRLVELVAQGLLRVPDWQRLFKWGPKDIAALLDSIERGYPVGTLLLWKRSSPAPAERLTIGPHTISAPESSEALWVIDGRQRVTSLAGLLFRRGTPDRPPDSRDPFTWAYDLAKSAWYNPRPGEAWKNEWLPADRLVDAMDLVTWLLARADVLTPAQKQRANALGRDIREFEIPAIVVRAESDETLRVIFDRTNNAGKKLTVSETFDALQGALTNTQPSTIRALARVPVELGFGELDQDWLLRLVVQVSGGDMTRVSRDTLEKKELAAALPRAAEALRRTLVFMQREVGIPHEALLPYRLPLVVLSVFFDRHPQPKPRTLDLLSRWVWRGAIGEQHRGQSVSEVRELFGAIDGDEEASVQRLLRSPRLGWTREQTVLGLSGDEELSSEVGLLGAPDARTAQTRLQLLALASLQPRDLRTGEPLDVTALVVSSKSKALRPIVPVARATRLADTIVNRVIQPEAQRDVRALLTNAAPEWAASHAVSNEAQGLLRRQEYEAFLLARFESLETIVRAFFESRARWHEPSRPSIDSLIVEDRP